MMQKSYKLKNSSFNLASGRRLFALFFILLASLLFFSGMAYAAPGGPVVLANSTDIGPTQPAALRQDPRGTITNISFSFVQQNMRWKAYVGNVSGAYSLRDSSNYTIYDWTFSSNSGEVYATRANSVTWTAVSCADTTDVSTEQGAMNETESNSDVISKTFNKVVHRAFSVGTVPISLNTCNSTATYLNSAAQAYNETTTKFQEVLMHDGASAFIYTALLDYDTSGYNNKFYDFQMLVAEDEGAAAPTPYYFYVELI